MHHDLFPAIHCRGQPKNLHNVAQSTTWKNLVLLDFFVVTLEKKKTTNDTVNPQYNGSPLHTTDRHLCSARQLQGQDCNGYFFLFWIIFLVKPHRKRVWNAIARKEKSNKKWSNALTFEKFPVGHPNLSFCNLIFMNNAYTYIQLAVYVLRFHCQTKINTKWRHIIK
jgi:hypothetical protein